MPKNKKTITDSLGYALNLELKATSLQITAEASSDAITLSRLDVEIFKAFLDRAIALPKSEACEEFLTGEAKLSFHDERPPFIRIETSGARIDVHPASWLPLTCELALITPRMAKAA